MDFLILALTAAGATMAIDHYADDTIHSQTKAPVAPVVNEQIVVADNSIETIDWTNTETNNTGTANGVTWVFEVGVKQ